MIWNFLLLLLIKENKWFWLWKITENLVYDQLWNLNGVMRTFFLSMESKFPFSPRRSLLFISLAGFVTCFILLLWTYLMHACYAFSMFSISNIWIPNILVNYTFFHFLFLSHFFSHSFSLSFSISLSHFPSLSHVLCVYLSVSLSFQYLCRILSVSFSLSKFSLPLYYFLILLCFVFSIPPPLPMYVKNLYFYPILISSLHFTRLI